MRYPPYGYAWGYLGILHSVSCSTDCPRVGAGYGRVLPDFVSKMIGFGVTALWWLVVTLPFAEGVSAEIRGNENGYRRSDVGKYSRTLKKSQFQMGKYFSF